MDDLLNEFLTETAESLDVVDSELVKFERDPNNSDVLGRIFRLVHTIKGTCGFIGLPRLERVAHHAESVLGKYRDGIIPVTQAGVTVVLQAIDCIKSILAGLAADQKEPDGDDSTLLAALEVAAQGEAPALAAVAIAEPTAKMVRPGEVAPDDLEAAFRNAPGPDVAPAHVAAPVAADPVAADRAEHGDAPRNDPAIASQSLRVSVEVLEELMNMVSELVLTRNQLMDMVRRIDDSEFKVPLQRLSTVTAELQESVMKTRMQPVGNAWSKLPRVVRDLANELGKKIDLVMTGADTELDRQVLEMIKDPLTHMVRNSADHGLERPTDRRASGKSETGTITLKAYHQGGHIIIEIADDGRGLDVNKIRTKVRERKLVAEDELARLTDAQVQRFIFHPGFSTVEKVTSVSGRGVGMDVVRTNIELIGGTIDMTSALGRGTSFTIKIPLTLAIMSSLIVGSARQRFALPQVCVVELVHASKRSANWIETINTTPLLRLREKLLPLVFLCDVLGTAGAIKPNEDQGAFIVVVDVGSRRFGIVVDAVYDTEEIVVKPLASMLRSITAFSGTTILGDGSVIMILDPTGVSQAIGQDETSARNDNDGKATDSAAIKAGVNGAGDSLLVFRAGGSQLKAIPLSLVTRLEEIEVSRIETSDNRPVVQYRGRLMPLVAASATQSFRTEGKQPVVVFADGSRAIGLAVDEIVDIVRQRLDIEMRASAPGLAGTAVVSGVATEVLDVGYFLTSAYPDWFDRQAKTKAEKSRTILVVDDSAFYRNMIAPLLAAAGYEVTAASGPEEALRLKDMGIAFDVIVSDIEMPGMDGISFAMTVRNDAAWKETPLFALSSHAQPADVERGLKAGFNDYFSKSDHNKLIARIEETLTPRGIAA